MSAIQHFSTDQVAPERRLDYWNDCAAATFAGMTIDTAVSQFRAEMTRWRLGGLIMARPQSRGSLVQRAADPDDERVIVHVQRRGRGEQRQRGKAALLRPGDVSVCTTASPLAIRAEDHEMLVIQAPRAPLDRRLPDLDDHLCCRVDGTSPGARILHDFILSLWREGEAAAGDPLWEEEIADILFDLLAMALRGHHPAQTQGHDDLARLKALVEVRLCDPALRGAVLAEELGVSLRWVQHLFAGQATTPGAYILSRRLDRAAERLGSGAGASITALAFDLGFNDSAYFSRCFRQRFGTTPSGYRQACGLDPSR